MTSARLYCLQMPVFPGANKRSSGFSLVKKKYLPSVSGSRLGPRRIQILHIIPATKTVVVDDARAVSGMASGMGELLQKDNIWGQSIHVLNARPFNAGTGKPAHSVPPLSTRGQDQWNEHCSAIDTPASVIVSTGLRYARHTPEWSYNSGVSFTINRETRA